jgi:hypothetical protein
VYGRALAHVRRLAGVERVHVRPRCLALRPAPFRRVGDAARNGVRDSDEKRDCCRVDALRDLGVVREDPTKASVPDGDRVAIDPLRRIRKA